jgi:hypothetical protein
MKRFGVTAIFLIVGCLVMAQVSRPVQFKEESFDFGNVAEENGPVSHEFVFTNAGNKPLQILSVKPSCGCTTPGWTKEPIMPGKTGVIKAQFDPKGRPGYFTKSLTVMTDQDNQPVMLYIKGTVSSSGKITKAEFRAPSGNLRFRSLSFNIGKVYRKDEYVVREYEFMNAGPKPVSYLGKYDGPAYLRVEVEPSTVNPGETGILKIGYNGKKKDQYGFQSDNIVLHTDDELLARKPFTIYATLEDYFGDLKPEDLARAAELRLTSQTVDYGSMKQDQAMTREVQLVNAGKSELEIRSVIPNCTCIQAIAGKTTLGAGESTTVRITFNPQSRKGTQTKSVTIYSSDPHHPVQRITLTGVVD